MWVKQTIYYLELTSPQKFSPAPPPKIKIVIKKLLVPCPEYNRFFYHLIGKNWHWIDRLNWSIEDWKNYVSRPQLETWIAYYGGNPTGYYEIEIQPDNNVELVYLGVLPEFSRKGIGRTLLSHAVNRAWQLGAKRIWLHTCSHDDPAALKLYLSHGFEIFKEEVVEKDFSLAK